MAPGLPSEPKPLQSLNGAAACHLTGLGPLLWEAQSPCRGLQARSWQARGPLEPGVPCLCCQRRGLPPESVSCRQAKSAPGYPGCRGVGLQCGSGVEAAPRRREHRTLGVHGSEGRHEDHGEPGGRAPSLPEPSCPSMPLGGTLLLSALVPSTVRCRRQGCPREALAASRAQLRESALPSPPGVVHCPGALPPHPLRRVGAHHRQQLLLPGLQPQHSGAQRQSRHHQGAGAHPQTRCWAGPGGEPGWVPPSGAEF